MSNSERIKYHPVPESRTVDAEIHRLEEGGEPEFVVIDNAVYRREDDQKARSLFLKRQAIEAKLRRTLSEEQGEELYQLVLATEEHEVYREERLREKLLELLPQHRSVIEHVFIPDEVDLRADEAYRHMNCHLPK